MIEKREGVYLALSWLGLSNKVTSSGERGECTEWVVESAIHLNVSVKKCLVFFYGSFLHLIVVINQSKSFFLTLTGEFLSDFVNNVCISFKFLTWLMNEMN